VALGYVAATLLVGLVAVVAALRLTEQAVRP
jgi:hypothetical protein